MKRIITLFILCVLTGFAKAQSWQALGPVDSFQVSNSAASFISAVADKTGILYIAFADAGDTNKVHVRKYNGNTWTDVGAAISSRYAASVSMTIDANGALYVAYPDNTNSNKAVVQKYNGTAWVLVGAQWFTSGGVSDLSIAMDTVNSIPYVAYVDMSNGNKASVKKYNGSAWIDVGTPNFSVGIATGTRIAIAPNGAPYVVYKDVGASGKAIVKKYDGTNWVAVGTNNVSTGGASIPAIAIDASGTPYVIYSDALVSSKDSVKKYNGTNWVPVAGTSSINTSAASYNAIAIAGSTPYITCVEAGIPVIKKFDGLNWVSVGPAMPTTANTVSYTTLVLSNNIPYLVFSDANNGGKAAVKKFDGTNWISLYNIGIATSSADYPCVAMDTAGRPYVAFSDGTSSGKLSVKKFDGTNWIYVGTPGISASTIGSVARIVIGKNNVPYVAYIDLSNITVKKYDGTNWVTVGTANFGIGGASDISLAIDTSGTTPYVCFSEVGINYDYLGVVKKYNGTAWVYVGGAVSTGSAYYTSIAITRDNKPYIAFQALDANYQNLGVIVKKFDGTNWVNEGTPGSTTVETSSDVIALDTAGKPYIAYQVYNIAASNYQIKAKKYDGANWVDISSGAIAINDNSQLFSLVVGKDNLPYLSYISDSVGKKVVVKKYENNTWSPVGSASVSAGECSYSSLAINKQKIIVAYRNSPGYLSGGSFAKQYLIPVQCDTANGLAVTNITTTTAYINWGVVAGVAGYEYIIDQVATTPATAGTAITTNLYNATGLVANTVYYIHLRTNCSGSNYSAWITKQFKTLPVCDTAMGLSISNITTSTASINWTAVSGAAGYEYTVDQVATAPTVAGTAITANLYNATGLNANTVYYIHLRTNCSGNNYSTWITKQFKTLPVCDTAMGLAVTNITTTTANINWTAVSGAAGYEYTVDQAATAPTVAGTAITANLYNATGLTANTVYYIHLRTNCSGNNYSTWITMEFKTLPICDTATGLSITNITTSTASINWSSVPGAAGYEYKIDQVATAPISGTAITTNSYNAVGLAPNTSYYYHMRTDCGNSNYAPWISQSFTTTPVGLGMTIKDTFSFMVYPNPVTDAFSVYTSGGNGPVTLKLTDVSGKCVKVIQVNNLKHINIDMRDIPSGLYWLKYTDSDHSKILAIQKM